MNGDNPTITHFVGPQGALAKGLYSLDERILTPGRHYVYLSDLSLLYIAFFRGPLRALDRKPNKNYWWAKKVGKKKQLFLTCPHCHRIIRVKDVILEDGLIGEVVEEMGDMCLICRSCDYSFWPYLNGTRGQQEFD